MNFRVACDLQYNLYNPATFLFALKCIETGGQKIISEAMTTNPFVTINDFTLNSGMNRFSRLRTLNPGTLQVQYQADVRTATQIVSIDKLYHDEPGNLRPEAIPFLFPSRYCPSDRFRQQGMDLFGHLTTSHGIAAGVSDWIFNHISYVSGSSGESSSAVETMEQRRGVCRDFAHLAITFCRSLNVPARYAACYAYQLNPPDFHACFEVFINGWWYVYDPTRLAPLNGLVRIATGRDAADAAVCTIFGNPELTSSIVSCECLDSDFLPVTCESLGSANQIIALM